ncbi:unnamed protein product [Adineta steineri]|nr:unnamed protein product [Adineta steineri]
MLVAPDYDAKLAPYGLRNQSSNDLFNALNAAINGVQNDGTDETLVTLNQRQDLIRVYTCRQSTQIPVVNRNDTTGFLQDILFNTKKLLIGGIGPSDWGAHDGNYKDRNPIGFYPGLLDKIVEKLGQLSGPDGNKYGEGLTIERTYYQDSGLLFSALLNGKIHATDVYTLVDVSYTGSGENCTKDNNTCRAEETCTENICTHAPRPRSLHFRTTCTTASRDTKFITKKLSGIKSIQPDAPRQTPKTRWIGFVLLFVTLFATVFLVLVILLRRKKNYRAQHTLQGGFGKFVRLQEESEPPMDGLDAFDDHIVQSPRDNTN